MTQRTIAGVTSQVLANALSATVDEMALTIFRTAHSAILRDAMDFSAALCSPDGETVAQAVTIPLQLGSVPAAMRTLLERFGDRMGPGDAYILNDPFDGGSHTPDLFVCSPIYSRGVHLGFAISIAHQGDIGGRVPGTIACDNAEIFEEGLRLPWVRLFVRGELQEDIRRILAANVRIPVEMLGDVSAQLAACRIGEQNLQSLGARYGEPILLDLMKELLDHSERLMRQAIGAWPDGSVTFTDYLDSDGFEVRDVPLRVRVTVSGDELTADFSESAEMVKGALNCTPSFVEASVYQAVMSAAEARIPCTSGAIRPVRVITRPGTVTHVVMPGASSMRGVTGYRLFDVMNGALAQLLPDRIPAAGEGGSTLAVFSGERESGERFVYDELVVGTWGGRPSGDGNDGLANACASMANIPIEVAEAEYPLVIERYGFVPDTGGPGRYRGGLALEREWRALRRMHLQVRSDRQIHLPYGLLGGEPGQRSENVICRADGGEERMPPMFGTVLEPGDSYYHRTAGGGGWGEMCERDPDLIMDDLENGKISPAAGEDQYGLARERALALGGRFKALSSAIGRAQ